MSDRRESWSRREFVSGLALAGTAGLVGIRPAQVEAEPPPETTSLKSSPQKILAQGTDWRFFNELRKELKG